MVPVKLTLKNFLCYKEETLVLDGIRLACLSGENGAGKSAIFDAMTWALWGKARATHDEIIMSGEIEMQVDFEFEVNGQLYRVVRTRSRKGSGTTQISFQIAKAEGGWQNISGNIVRETERKIVEVLKMEYETFVNSAFLRQGHADEFTVKTPGERKKVLAEILELAAYDAWETRAKEEWRENDALLKRLKLQIEEIELELNLRPNYEQKQKEANAKISEFKAILAQNEGQVTQLHAIVQDLKNKQARLAENNAKLQNDRAELNRLIENLPEIEKKIRDREAVIARGKEIEAGFKEYEIVNAAHEEMLEKYRLFRKLIVERQALEKKIDEIFQQIKADVRVYQERFNETEATSRNLPVLQKQYEASLKEIELLSKSKEENEKLKEKRQNLKVEERTLQSEIERVGETLENIKAKAFQVPASGEVCEHCGQVLSEEAREQTLQQRRNEYKVIQAENTQRNRLLKEIKIEIEETETKLKELEGVERKSSDLLKKSGRLESELKAAQVADNKKIEFDKKLKELRRQLETNDFCHTERQELANINQQARELAFDEGATRKLKEKVDSLKIYSEQKTNLDSARQTIETYRENAADNRHRQLRLKQQISETETICEILNKEVAGLAQANLNLETAQREKNIAEGQLKVFEQNLWEAQSKLKRCDELELEKKRKDTELTATAQQIQIYKDLEQAFGKKGVQALIIESVLPELEDEANLLLSRMTDGRMSIRFDTQANTKKGDPVETLELKISDENGVRAYELFSGGEAFRVNFAVRVALSKLLARRSGAALRTLIVDEGFGTQDGSGRERLVEAIRNIESEFDRILVITHIQELKDAFPVRIDVTKTAFGSRISIN